MKQTITVESTNVKDLEMVYKRYIEVKQNLENKQGLRVFFKVEIEIETV